jgi:hypothetical protein
VSSGRAHKLKLRYTAPLWCSGRDTL